MSSPNRIDALLQPLHAEMRALPPGGEMVVAFEDAVLTIRRTRPRKPGGKTSLDATWRYYDRVHLIHERTGENDDKPLAPREAVGR